MFTRDLERMARSLLAQRLEREYVCHYLMESYQIDRSMADAIMERSGATKAKPTLNKADLSKVKPRT